MCRRNFTRPQVMSESNGHLPAYSVNLVVQLVSPTLIRLGAAQFIVHCTVTSCP